VNSAYGNSPLCSELTRHSARPPEGGIYSVGITQKETTDFDRNLSFLFGFRAPREIDMPGRSESTLRQDSALQNACDAALAAKHNKAFVLWGAQKTSAA